jgi:maleate cis-trans isomerase
VTAAGAVRTALLALGLKRLALGTPYPESISAMGRAYWTAAGFDVMSHRRLGDVPDIYATTEASGRHAPAPKSRGAPALPPPSQLSSHRLSRLVGAP